jgi:hypothetical protein
MRSALRISKPADEPPSDRINLIAINIDQYCRGISESKQVAMKSG